MNKRARFIIDFVMYLATLLSIGYAYGTLHGFVAVALVFAYGIACFADGAA